MVDLTSTCLPTFVAANEEWLVADASVIVSIWFTSHVDAFSKLQANQSLKHDLQKCVTPVDLLKLVGSRVTIAADPDGSVSSLALVRLSKQILTLTNQGELIRDDVLEDAASWSQLANTLSGVLRQQLGCSCSGSPTIIINNNNKEVHVEAVKSMAVLGRILPDLQTVWKPYMDEFGRNACRLVVGLKSHQLSGLKWAHDCLASDMHPCLQEAYDDLQLPFRIIPDCLRKKDLSVAG
eukprot:CAMPEP_0116544660 /NCGR_PEP_ID=MMETSP0397-20121206/2239_1 /TAXON_ID=216820 /ORGANISM="Cyclophora tenuis, Strain ECT3854" /LENGTH=236 /DNA_ID=CAMNT_0004068893 /DNA_START=526 /DNA_END=1233 /DNA_ORIENTATION=+